MAFYAFFRLSNIAPHSARQFSKDKHFLRQDLIFQSPGAHLLVKWAKNLHDCNSSHIVQIPMVDNFFLCPVRALQTLLQSRPLPPQAPLQPLSCFPLPASHRHTVQGCLEVNFGHSKYLTLWTWFSHLQGFWSHICLRQ